MFGQPRRVVLLVWAALALATLVPLWSARWLPLYDYPNALAEVAGWLHYGDARYQLAGHYQLLRGPLPGYGFVAPVWLLAHVLSVEIAGKLWLGVIVLALPLGVARLAAQLGRDPLYAVFAMPLAYHFGVAAGFVDFAAGVVLLLFALAAADALLQAATPTRAAVTAALALALYFAHLLPWLFFAVALLPLAASHARRPRAILALLVSVAPTLLLAPWAWARARGHFGGDGPGWHVEWLPTLQRLSQLPHRLVAAWAGDGTHLSLLASGGLWLALVHSARAGAADADGTPRPGWRWRAEALFLVAVAAVMLVPERVHAPWRAEVVAGRLVALAALFAVLLPHGPIAGRRRALVVGAALLALYYPLRLASAWRAWDARVAGARRLITRIPRGASTLTVAMRSLPDPALDARLDPYAHLHAYAHLAAGGRDPFTPPSGLPLQPRLSGELIPFTDPTARERRLRPDIVRSFDYVVTRAEPQPFALFGPDGASLATLVASDTGWNLYVVRHEAPQP